MPNINSNKPNTKRQYRPTITFAYDAEAFGAGSLKSQPITKESIAKVKEFLIEGSRLLIKDIRQQATYGGRTFAIEILPPYEGGKKSVSKNTESESDI